MKYLIIMSLFLSGCAIPQMVRENAKGGRVVVLGSRSIAADSGDEKAKKMMSTKCPGGYTITETGLTDTGHANIGALATNTNDKYYDFECK